MELDEILLNAEEHMEKAVTYLKGELRGVRTGRASAGLVEFTKIDYYGTQSDLRQLARVSVPEATQILITPFDPGSIQAIVKALQSSGLGMNPIADGKQIRLAIPPLTGERRHQLAGSVKQMGEDSKVTIRNARRDGNKHIDQLAKDKSSRTSEDDAKNAKEQIQELLKQYESEVGALIVHKAKEIQEA